MGGIGKWSRVVIDTEEGGNVEQRNGLSTKVHRKILVLFKPCMPGVPHMHKGIKWKRSLHLIPLYFRVSPRFIVFSSNPSLKDESGLHPFSQPLQDKSQSQCLQSEAE